MTFWNFFFLMLIYVPLILLWVFTLVDLAHRRDLSSLAKGLWAVAVVFLPLIGMLVYFATRPEAVETPTATGSLPPEDALVPPTQDQLDEIEKLAGLRDSGMLTDEEFSSLKAKILG